MPLDKKDAERALEILWQLRFQLQQQSPDQEQQEGTLHKKEDVVITKPISILQRYVTVMLPVANPKVNLFPSDTNIQVQFSPQARVQMVEINCGQLQSYDSLGLSLFNYTTHEGRQNYCVSRIEKGSFLQHQDLFKRGDIILSINKHYLSRVSLEKASWLLKSAARSKKLSITMITCDGRTIPYPYNTGELYPSIDSQYNISQQLNAALPNTTGLMSIPVQAEVHAMVESNMRMEQERDPAVHKNRDIFRRPSFTPSIGSKDSNHEALINTVEVAAHFSRSSFRYSKRRLKGMNKKLKKVSLHKDTDGSLGIRLIGGKGTKFGDTGIFVAKLEKDRPADNDGRIQTGDEILMVNGRSVVGLKISETVEILKQSSSPVHFVIASKPVQDDMTAQSSVSIGSTNESEIYDLMKQRENLGPPPPLITRNSPTKGHIKKPLLSEDSQRQLKRVHRPHNLRTQISAPITTNATPPNTHQLIELRSINNNKPSDSPHLARLAKQPITQWGRLTTTNLIKHPQNTTPQPSKEVTIALLKSDTIPLGFSLCGGKGSKRGDIGLYVRNVSQGGQADKDGRLHPGDELLAINGQMLNGMAHKEAAQIIKKIKQGVISLHIKTGPGYLDLPNEVQRSPSVRGTHYSVPLFKRADEEVGLELAGLTDNQDEYGVFINHIIPNSPADISKGLHRADQLISINGNSVLDNTYEEIESTLSQLPVGPVTLEVVRPQSVEPLNKLLSNIKKDGGNTYRTENGSFRMKQKKFQSKPNHHHEEEEEMREALTSHNLPLSPFDKDILDLFTHHEVEESLPQPMTPTEPHDPEKEFPTLVSTIRQLTENVTEENEEESILTSMTPILTRPSIASQYTPTSSPRGSSTDLELHQMSRPISGLISFRHVSKDEDDQTDSVGLNETSFNEVPPTTFPETLDDTNVPLLPSSPPPPPPPPPPQEEEEEEEHHQRLPLGFKEMQVTIKKQAKKDIGITLVKSGGITSGYPLIKRVIPGSVGSRCGLKRGDRLVSIDDQLVQGLTPGQIMPLFATAPKVFPLILWRNPEYDDSETPSSIYSGSAGLSESSGGKQWLSDTPSSPASTVRGTLDTDTNTELLHASQFHDSPISLPKELPTTPIPISFPPPPPTEEIPAMPTSLPPLTPTEEIPAIPTSLPPPTPTALYEEIDVMPTSPPPTEEIPKVPTSLPPPPPTEEIPAMPTSLPPPPPTEEIPAMPTSLPPPPPTEEIPPMPNSLPPPPPTEDISKVPTSLPPPPPTEEIPAMPTSLPPPSPTALYEEIHVMPTSLPPPPPTEEIPAMPTSLPPPSPTALYEEIHVMPTSLPPPPPTEEIPKVPTSLPPSIPTENSPAMPTSLPPPHSPAASKPPSSPAVKKQAPPVPAPYSSPRTKRPLIPTARSEGSPFQVEVNKGLFGLGLTVTMNSLCGQISVKNITNRSPLTKDGRLRNGDLILSINDHELTGVSTQAAENIIKSLPKGAIKIIAMSPPRDITQGNKVSTVKPNDEKPTEKPTEKPSIKSEVKTEVKQPSEETKTDNNNKQQDIKPLLQEEIPVVEEEEEEDESPENSLGVGRDKDEGIVRVMLKREQGTSLGIDLEGGVDTPQQYIYIKGIQQGSVADQCGQLKRGDLLISCGKKCIIGMTSIEAWDTLRRAPLTSKIVIARKKESLLQLRSLEEEGIVPGAISLPDQTITRPISRSKENRLSLHFTSTTDLSSPTSGPPNLSLERNTSSDNVVSMFIETPSPKLKPIPLAPEFLEDLFTVILERDEGQKLGFVVQGGADNESLPHPHVKYVEQGSVADLNGQIKRGDKLISVDGTPLAGLTHKEALRVLKKTGLTVKFEMSRKVGHSTSSVSQSRLTSKIHSKQVSAEATPPGSVSSGSPSPLLPRHGLRGKRSQSTASRLGLVQSQGIKVVELHKGPTGLGMHLKGSLNIDQTTPITIKEVLPGGVAYKSGQIAVGDILLEANGIHFDNMTQTIAVGKIKNLPQGTVRLVLLDKHYISMTTTTNSNGELK